MNYQKVEHVTLRFTEDEPFWETIQKAEEEIDETSEEMSKDLWEGFIVEKIDPVGNSVTIHLTRES